MRRHIGRGWRGALSVYHSLLTMSWGRFLFVAAAFFLAFNLAVSLAYLACDPRAVVGPETGGRCLRTFFFSVQTSSTVGYGRLAPGNLPANIVMVVQAFGSLMPVALATGLSFARFSRPVADFAWSERAVIGPHRGAFALMFRIANRRKNQLFDLHVKVILSFFEQDPDDGGMLMDIRRIHEFERV